MNILLAIHQPQWRHIFTIPQGTVLQKGRHGPYDDIMGATASVTERFGCYSWGGNSVIYYCGSFAKDYKSGDFKSNLQGRIRNYLQNHGQESTGRKNTNLMVFENINAVLKQNAVLLQLFTFESLRFGNDVVDFATFSTDSELVLAVEQLLISAYRKQGQCKWIRRT